MGTVRIAHISDLHFGATLQQGTWGVLKAHLGGLAAEGQLHLVLVTGDVVNTPKNSLFKQASDALESLGVDYLVCSGNHDRHPLGNSWKAVRFINWAARRAANFSDHFVGKIPTLKDFRDVALQSEEDHWLLRIASVDSSLKADISARGYVELPLNHLAAADEQFG